MFMKELIHHLCSQLLTLYPADEAHALAWWIVEECTGLSHNEILLACKDTTFFSKEQSFFDKNNAFAHNASLVEQCQQAVDRLLKHEPIQYIFGHTVWNGLDLLVSPATLIPRPETAEILEHIRSLANQNQWSQKPLRVLDVGTGSGCIAIALKKCFPAWDITAIDISADALDIAQQNAVRNGVHIHFDSFDVLHDEIEHLGRFDIVVSNPPYICEKEKSSMRQNVLDYEPSLALFVPDQDPLLFYRTIAAWKAGTHLFFEINEAYATPMQTMLEEQGYTHIQTHSDIYGKPRISQAALPL